MDVFVIPVGPDRYELYCEVAEVPPREGEVPSGFVARLGQRFSDLMKAAEAKRHGGVSQTEAPASWWARGMDWCMAWVAERVAEQRLLWNLRGEQAAVAVHPADLTFNQTMELVRRMLRRDYDRHRRWLVVDVLGLVISGLLAIVPGPNMLAYFFAFRVVGHWLSMRGAQQGLRRVEWSGQSSLHLSELRRIVALEPDERDRRVHEIAASLRLPHLPTFVERVAMTRA